MRETLKKIREINAENCVTIALNTHRTRPDSEKDSIHLKNLIKEAEERIFADQSKQDAQKLVQRLRDLATNIDHSHNLESLLLFVNDEISEYVRLPIAVVDRVVIDNTFATRDMVRALHMESNYYVLVLSKQNSRLIEAVNDSVVKEVGSPFPFDNTTFSKTKADINRQTSMIAEYFNQVDKVVNEVRKSNSLPVLICTEVSNFSEYLKIADQKDSIFETFLNKNRLDEPAHHIVSEAWGIVKQEIKGRNNARKEELEQAVSSGHFLSETNEIWRAIHEGRVQTLFIEQGRFQPARVEKDQITHVSDDMRNEKGIVDDIYDEMIEANTNFGGDVVFLPKGELDKFNGLGAITRY